MVMGYKKLNKERINEFIKILKIQGWEVRKSFSIQKNDIG